jgi:hypothetical protein
MRAYARGRGRWKRRERRAREKPNAEPVRPGSAAEPEERFFARRGGLRMTAAQALALAEHEGKCQRKSEIMRADEHD